MTARFEFGSNWLRFLETVDEQRIAAAVESLQTMLQAESLDGLRFLDVGSGSGLFSLAAHRLGAEVRSFDYDPDSVACTREMKQRFGSDSPNWTVESGSALDEDYLSSLGAFDIVYSWGVLHHTGEMWNAVERTANTVADGGKFFLAIYNDQGEISRRWTEVKQLYQRLPKFLRPPLVALVGASLLARKICGTIGHFLLRLLLFKNPFAPVQSLGESITRKDPRGMSRWYDLVDWVGGWPFEVAKPEQVIEFLQQRGFSLVKLKTCGGKMGCNEFVFRKDS
ncbi:MAG TPA: class I SAM-dependent methyltransferase [Planctomycetaceae bacterium]|nr:class I SAM-dependent methyltransferase [Planctomycetaceae bacterium]